MKHVLKIYGFLNNFYTNFTFQKNFITYKYVLSYKNHALNFNYKMLNKKYNNIWLLCLTDMKYL